MGGGIGSIFLVVALLTTYWAVSLALADVIAERTGVGFRAAWLAATLPSLLLLYVGAMGFLEWVRLAAGLTAIVIAFVTIPMYLNARRRPGPRIRLELRPLGQSADARAGASWRPC